MGPCQMMSRAASAGASAAPGRKSIAPVMCIAAIALCLMLVSGANGQSICGPGSGDCCAANSSPGCEHVGCCEAVCACDPFCCNVDWDHHCAGPGWNPDCLCGISGCGVENTPECSHCWIGACSAGNGDAGDCCSTTATPGCDDPECCEAICMADPFCCTVAWDELCANVASKRCKVCVPCSTCDEPLCPGDMTGDKEVGVADLLAMLGAWGPCADGCPGCVGDMTCSGSVGVADLLALLGNWGDCPLLPATCGPGNGNCCGPGNATPGCSDVACCAAICAIDMFCCEVVWDFVCGGAAKEICETCVSDPCGPAGGGGDCCEPAPVGGAGCVDSPCCATVCAILPECCTDHWSETCAGIAAAKCAVCEQGLCVPGAGDCCVGGTTPGCDDPKCCDCVCAQDPFCCETCWDNLCANAANNVCAASCPCVDPSCGPGAGDCCVGGTTPGCDDTECCTAICAQDPFCCDVRWDGLCAAAAVNQCDVCQSGSCCLPDGSCQQTAGAAACNGLGGTFQGGGTDCDFVFCSGPCSLGDCCMPGGNGSPGCEDPECCQCVCALDPFCCDVLWDFLCADQANGVCAGSCVSCE